MDSVWSFLGGLWEATSPLSVTLTVFCLLGAWQVADLVIRNLRFAYTQYFRSQRDLLARYGANSWCVITGGSDGIGLGFAVEFARLGFNICIISRTPEKLVTARNIILNANSNVQVRVIQRDFRHDSYTLNFWNNLWDEIKDLDISILVNNVGINLTQRFQEIPEQFLLDIVHVNCLPQVMMTRMVINHMVTRPQRSAIISVSSIAGQRPLLYLSPYSATKAFNDFFSRALALEFEEKIDVMSLRPGYVVSNMSKLTEKGGFVLDRYECARGCLDKLGFVSETYGDPRHAIYARSYFSMPEFVISERRRQRLVEKNAPKKTD